MDRRDGHKSVRIDFIDQDAGRERWSGEGSAASDIEETEEDTVDDGVTSASAPALKA